MEIGGFGTLTASPRVRQVIAKDGAPRRGTVVA